MKLHLLLMAKVGQTSKHRPARAAPPRDDTEELVRTLQTEFKGKTRDDIRHAITQARAAGQGKFSPDHMLEQARVLLGAGSRG